MSALIERIYALLLEAYGQQGWWPLQSRAGTPGFDDRGYHPGEYGVPAADEERFEIAAGAVLTQNTAWPNAARALKTLLSAGIRTPAGVLTVPKSELAGHLLSSGYYNQKARKLRALSDLLVKNGGPGWEALSREDLLGVWGIGPETADSILLYACGRPVFVVDAYTCRLLERLGSQKAGQGYTAVQALFSAALPPDTTLFQEYHALIVHHAKRFCRKQPACRDCPLLDLPCARGRAASI